MGNTGEMDEQITFQTETQTIDRGEVVRAWATDSPPDMVWAKIVSERGSETFESARQNARQTIRAKIRFRDDINTSHRFLWGGLAWYIKYVDKSERRKGNLWLTAETLGVQ